MSIISNFPSHNGLGSDIQDANIAVRILGWGNLHQQRENDEHHAATDAYLAEIDTNQAATDAHQAEIDAEILGETETVTLTNTESYPFNSTVDTPVTVALATTRKNLYYTVESEVAEHTGLVGNIHITDKAVNGFKVAFDGSGTSVTLTLRIKGGMT